MRKEKFKNLVLYVLSNSHYEDKGIKKLNKILYFIDFYFYRDHECFISNGVKYAKAEMGPVVDKYKEIFQEMIKKDKILERTERCGVILHKPKIKADISTFSSEEIEHVHNVLERYGKLSSAELEGISHEQQPWILTNNYGEIIDPDLALLIDNESAEETEIKKRGLKKELIKLANNARV